MLGMVRVLSSIRVDGAEAMDPGVAWGIYCKWRSDPSVTFVHEPAGTQEILSEIVAQDLIRARFWPDAYLAAFALAGNLRLVSFDSDFARFPGLDWLHLKP